MVLKLNRTMIQGEDGVQPHADHAPPLARGTVGAGGVGGGGGVGVQTHPPRYLPPPNFRPQVSLQSQMQARQAMARQAWVMKAVQLRDLLGNIPRGHVPKAKLVERCARGLEDGTISSARFWKVANMRDVPKEAKVAQVANVGAKEWKEVQQVQQAQDAKDAPVVGGDDNNNNNNGNNNNKKNTKNNTNGLSSLSDAAAAARHARARAHAYADGGVPTILPPACRTGTGGPRCPMTAVRGLKAPQLRELLGPVPAFGKYVKKDALVERCARALEAGTITRAQFWEVANRPAPVPSTYADRYVPPAYAPVPSSYLAATALVTAAGYAPYAPMAAGSDAYTKALIVAKDEEIRALKARVQALDRETAKLRHEMGKRTGDDAALEGEISRLRHELNLSTSNKPELNTSNKPCDDDTQEQFKPSADKETPKVEQQDTSDNDNANANASPVVAQRSMRKRKISVDDTPTPNKPRPKDKTAENPTKEKKGASSAAKEKKGASSTATTKKKQKTPSKTPAVSLRSRRKRSARNR